MQQSLFPAILTLARWTKKMPCKHVVHSSFVKCEFLTYSAHVSEADAQMGNDGTFAFHWGTCSNEFWLLYLLLFHRIKWVCFELRLSITSPVRYLHPLKELQRLVRPMSLIWCFSEINQKDNFASQIILLTQSGCEQAEKFADLPTFTLPNLQKYSRMIYRSKKLQIRNDWQLPFEAPPLPLISHQ